MCAYKNDTYLFEASWVYLRDEFLDFVIGNIIL